MTCWSERSPPSVHLHRSQGALVPGSEAYPGTFSGAQGTCETQSLSETAKLRDFLVVQWLGGSQIQRAGSSIPGQELDLRCRNED